MKQIMLDLETLGTGNNSVIVAIGAVKFDISGVYDKFYTTVCPKSCVDNGLVMDADTVLWWMRQSDDARKMFDVPGVSLIEALFQFSNFYEKDTNIWGNGSEFDNTILSNAYKKAYMKQPWEFWNSKCYRTVKSLHDDVKIKRSGIHHCAIDDAVSQAEHLIEIAKAKGFTL